MSRSCVSWTGAWVLETRPSARPDATHSVVRSFARSLVRQVVKHVGGPAGYGTYIRFFARFQILLSLALFIVMTVWKYSYENNFYVSDELVLLNLSMGGVQAVLYLVIGASFCHHLVKAIRKNRSMNREVNPRRRLAIVMAALDLIAGLVTITAFISSNAVSIANEGCGYFLGVNKVRALDRLARSGASRRPSRLTLSVRSFVGSFSRSWRRFVRSRWASSCRTKCA